MIRRAVLLLTAAVLLSACAGGSPPEVVFTAGGAMVTARPAQYCDLKLTSCDADETAPVQLAVPAGTSLQVRVPTEISEAPWTVVFSYRSAAGEQVDGRSPLFPPSARSDYALELPAPGDKLLSAQVQQVGAPPRANEETGEVEFPVRGSWVLAATG